MRPRNSLSNGWLHLATRAEIATLSRASRETLLSVKRAFVGRLLRLGGERCAVQWVVTFSKTQTARKRVHTRTVGAFARPQSPKVGLRPGHLLENDRLRSRASCRFPGVRSMATVAALDTPWTPHSALKERFWGRRPHPSPLRLSPLSTQRASMSSRIDASGSSATYRASHMIWGGILIP